ncbi:alpha/beta hydrolase [Saccharomonospora sp. NPDC006951]
MRKPGTGQASQDRHGRPIFVLVHSPLVGPSAWEPTAATLRESGYLVVVPSLAAGIGGTGPCYPRLAGLVSAAVAESGAAGPVVLVAHSGAGPLLPAIAETLSLPVVATVFVDAQLPHPGRSWLAAAPEAIGDQLRGLAVGGTLPPWNQWFPPDVIAALLPEPERRERFVAELPRLPLSYFEETAPETGGPNVPCAYVRLSEGYDRQATTCAGRGDPVVRADSDHLAPYTDPGTVAVALREAVSRLGLG